ncbi:MAG: TIR domain-containing protein [Rhizobiaceae bacterium]
MFLSHSGIDSDAAMALKRRILETEAAKQAGLQVWLDKDDLVPGLDDWQKQLEIALTRTATAFMVLVGSKGVVNWVEREVRIGLSRATGEDAIPFVSVLANDSVSTSALPAFAQQHQSVTDPLGNEQELQRLVAALLVRKPAETPLLAEPFVGLRSMREEDAARFFGRDGEIRELVGSLRRHRLLAIVADSGAGKSSLAMAGLVPAYKGGAFADPAGRSPDKRVWHVVVMRPGDDPLEGMRRGLTEAAERMGVAPSERAALRTRLSFANLSESAYALRCDLPAGTTETLLVVDQFEELLTETPEHLRAPFIDFLMQLSALREPGGFRILLTVRADYFNLCKPFADLYARLAAAADPATLRLKRISDEGLMEAVRKPLELAGYRKAEDTDRLANRTRRDLSDRPGDLALAQMALYVVWRRRRAPDGTLIDAYTDVGGVTGALAQEAERVRTDKLTPAEAALLAPLFVRLIRLGDTGGAIRRICLRDELDPPRLDLADKLCSDEFGRLLLAGDGTFDVCHEALITQWPWLQDELHRSAADLRDFEPLMRRASAWKAAQEGDRPGHLATGVERAAFAALAARRPGWLSASEVAFVAASDRAHQEELDYREQQRDAQARAARFRKWAARGAIAAAILLAVIAGLAVNSALEARRQAELAVAETERARAAQLAADDAATRAREAAERATLNETISLAALSRVAIADGLPVDAVKLALTAWPSRISPDRPALRRTVQALAAALPLLKERLRFPGGGSAAALSRDGRRLAIGTWTGDAGIWDTETGKELVSFRGKHVLVVQGIAFSPDEKHVATASADGTARIWDVATGAEVSSFTRHRGQVSGIAYSPDGREVATSGWDGVVRIWDPSTGAEIRSLGPDGGPPAMGVAWSPSGTRIASLFLGEGVVVRDVATGAEIARFSPYQARALSLAFSPDSTRVVTGMDDGTTRIWAAATGVELLALRGHTGIVQSATFSPDGSRVVTASQDRTVRLWDPLTGAEVDRLLGHEAGASAALMSPDGHRVLSVGIDFNTIVWEVDSDPRTATSRPDASVAAIAFSPDGSRVLSTHADNTVRTWSPDLSTELSRFETDPTLGAANFSAGSSADRSLVLPATWVAPAKLWNVQTGEVVGSFGEPGASVASTAVSMDGSRVALGLGDGSVKVFAVSTGELDFEIPAFPYSITAIAFSNDAGRLAVAWQNNAYVWDTTRQDQPPVPLLGHTSLVNSIAFTADGKRLVTASFDSTARIWDAQTGAELARLLGHTGNLRQAVFSPDGSRVVTSALDGTVRLWDPVTGAELYRENVYGLAAWSADGQRIAIGGETMSIWDARRFEQGDAFDVACKRLGSNTALDLTAGRYGLSSLPPVCGENPSLPRDASSLQ